MKSSSSVTAVKIKKSVIEREVHVDETAKKHQVTDGRGRAVLRPTFNHDATSTLREPVDSPSSVPRRPLSWVCKENIFELVSANDGRRNLHVDVSPSITANFDKSLETQSLGRDSKQVVEKTVDWLKASPALTEKATTQSRPLQKLQVVKKVAQEECGSGGSACGRKSCSTFSECNSGSSHRSSPLFSEPNERFRVEGEETPLPPTEAAQRIWRLKQRIAALDAELVERRCWKQTFDRSDADDCETTTRLSPVPPQVDVAVAKLVDVPLAPPKLTSIALPSILEPDSTTAYPKSPLASETNSRRAPRLRHHHGSPRSASVSPKPPTTTNPESPEKPRATAEDGAEDDAADGECWREDVEAIQYLMDVSVRCLPHESHTFFKSYLESVLDDVTASRAHRRPEEGGSDSSEFEL